jgi:hypothetical protein
MAQPNNPFGAPPGAPTPVVPGGNPFDPFAQAPPVNAQPMMAQGPGTGQPMPAVGGPFSAPQAHQQPPQQQFQQPPQQQLQQNFQQPPPQQHQMQAQQPYAQQQSPFQQAPPAAPQQNALVPAQQQSNPYADVVNPQAATDPFANYQQQAMVPAPQQASPWAAQPPAQAPAPAPAGNPFDPFAFAPPAPPPAAPAPAAPIADPFPIFAAETQQQQALVPAPGPSPYAMAPEPAQYGQQNDQNSWLPTDAGSTANYANNEMPPYAQNEVVPYTEPEPEPRPELHHMNKYSGILAGQAPPNAAPLPQGEKVLKSGYVLSRISFRTILLKKWKQTYWVQYGPHTMLWFRTYSDFDDWLNNPYHTQQQRNFLIKLAVNFVHDLYKPNVRGYQVTQARSKQYKNKILRQFKLERWMDYGPTIAAAFASSDPKEADELRQAIVECMRNTPVGEGIRATGAVRQGDEQGGNFEQPHEGVQGGAVDSSQRSAPSYRERKFLMTIGKRLAKRNLKLLACLTNRFLCALQKVGITMLEVFLTLLLGTSWTTKEGLTTLLLLREETILLRVMILSGRRLTSSSKCLHSNNINSKHPRTSRIKGNTSNSSRQGLQDTSSRERAKHLICLLSTNKCNTGSSPSFSIF